MLKLVLRIPGRRKVYCIGRLGHFQLQTVLHRLFPPLFGLMCLGSDSWHSAVSLLMHFEHGLFASSPHCRCLQGAHAVCDPCAACEGPLFHATDTQWMFSGFCL